ncbi:hypothetical protein ACG9Y2_05915, partial [Acinetobacter baumannii]
IYGIRSTTYPSYALNLAQLGALCLSNLCATKPIDFKRYFKLILIYNFHKFVFERAYEVTK